jgi:cellulose synthase/poly-beta-1,6-N-acetylglucosamine synthase-like glycosyltransferase
MLASEAQVAATVERIMGPRLVERAETLAEARFSARSISPARSAPALGAALGGVLVWGLLHAQSLVLALSVWAVGTLAMATVLRVLAAATHMRPRRPEPPRAEPARLPVVSMLVPLLREEAIAGRLMKRLQRVDYPRELLDVVLVVEAEDRVTRETLAGLALPAFMRVVEVPPGAVRTKPRALNYALPHCRGSIVGVWDAEDMPAPDQLRQVVRRFAARGPEVACLQGRLDYYNAEQNPISRLFAIEYAAWFGVFLPGIERLGLPVPLGGTTLFLRREAIEAVGGWDAHNVTEDADLGLRLARRGYRTEVVDTVTLEEATSRPVPWIRQRSRWLKGYALTWAVHMRNPLALWRDLGTAGFLGVQAVFLATVSQFALAPLLWSFLAASFGAPHPLAGIVPPVGLVALGALFVASLVVDWGVAAWAVSGPRHRRLIPWVALTIPYYWMATAAMWKALWEIAVSPFYWDKTDHGGSQPAEEPPTRPPAARARPR